MNRDDIIRMAREAGFAHEVATGHIVATSGYTEVICTAGLERFAALVAAAERDRIANEAKHIIKRAEARGAAAEREACAKVCESKMPNPVVNWADAQIVEALRDCAADIRARGQA